jgi:hypothetical protein
MAEPAVAHQPQRMDREALSTGSRALSPWQVVEPHLAVGLNVEQSQFTDFGR